MLLIVIAFLDVAAVFLVKKDKTAYIYQSQSSQAVLAGREFVNMVRRGIDTFRLILASADPNNIKKGLTKNESALIQSIVDNQSDMLSIKLYIYDKSLVLLSDSSNAKTLEKNAIKSSDFELSVEVLDKLLPELIKNSYVILNMTKNAGAPMLGIVLADKNVLGNSQMLLAFGVVSLREFGQQLNGLNMTIATRTKRLLFDTDSSLYFSTTDHLADDELFQTAISGGGESGTKEYKMAEARFLGSYVNPGLDIVVLNRVEWNKAMAATYDLTTKFILLGLMAIGVAVIFNLLFAKQLMAPFLQLYAATKELAEGNFDVQLKVNGRDEIAALSRSFLAMSQRLNSLVREKVEMVYLENEIAIASTVQQTLLPPPIFKTKNVYINSYYQLATQCGGDWWGFFGIGDKLAIMIADATGHGIPSALITAAARSCFSVMHKLAQEDEDFTFSPSAMLAFANRVIYDASLTEIMMTFFIVVIDFNENTLTYSNAGHNPPWLFSKNDNNGFTLKSLTASGNRLGEGRDTDSFEEKSIEFKAGDILFLYTDGMTEAKNTAGAMFGKKRLKQLVEGNLKGGPDKIIEVLTREIMEYNQGKALDDDVTLVAATLMPPPS